MKRTLLLLTLCASFFVNDATAQNEPNTITVFDQAVYYGMYEATVSEPVPAGAIRHSNSSYGKKLTAEQIASFGNTLTMNVTLTPLCDNYDRIGNVNLALVPKNSTTYDYDEVERIELGRFITPFMDLRVDVDAPYVFDIDNVVKILHDETLGAAYDFWVELEVYGYQGGPGQGGAAVEIPECAGRNDVYMGTLEFESSTNPNLTLGENLFKPLIHKYELKNYTLDGTDVLGQTTKTITFTLEENFPDAKLYLITSNHGNQEEFVRRNHFVYFDGGQVSMYKPGGVSCVPYRPLNTQPNCIYIVCPDPNDPNAPAPYWRPDTDAAWSWNNWCPGNKIPTRVIALGDLTAGQHSFKIEVPNAQFLNSDGNPDGYFPMSVYLQGGTDVLGTSKVDKFSYSVSPNPVSNIATINTAKEVKNVIVYNTLGQQVLIAKTKQVDFSALNSGVYFMNIQFDDNKTVTQKIIKN